MKKNSNSRLHLESVSSEFGISVGILSDWIATVDVSDGPSEDEEIVDSESPEPPHDISDITVPSSDVSGDESSLKHDDDPMVLDAKSTVEPDSSVNTNKIVCETNELVGSSVDNSDIIMSSRNDDLSKEVDISEDAKLAIKKGLPLMNVSLLYGIPHECLLEWIAKEDSAKMKTKEVIEIVDETPKKKSKTEECDSTTGEENSSILVSDVAEEGNEGICKIDESDQISENLKCASNDNTDIEPTSTSEADENQCETDAQVVQESQGSSAMSVSGRLSSESMLTELASYCTKMSKIGYYYTNSQINKIAICFFKANETDIPDNWFEKLLEQNQCLNSIILEESASIPLTPENVASYYSQLKTTLENYGLFNLPDKIWILDETMLVCHKDSPSFTVVACANGFGKTVPPYIICEGDKKGNDVHKSVLTYTCEKGETSSSEAYITFFRDHFPRYCETPAIVLVDGQNASVGLPIIDILSRNGIYVFVLPPHMSHVARLNRGEDLLGPFSKNLSQVIFEIFSVQSRKRIVKDELFEIVHKVYELSYTEDNIVNAFKKMGVCPYDPVS